MLAIRLVLGIVTVLGTGHMTGAMQQQRLHGFHAAIDVTGYRRLELVNPAGRRLIVENDEVVSNQIGGVTTDLLSEDDIDSSRDLVNVLRVDMEAPVAGNWRLRVVPRVEKSLEVTVVGRLQSGDECSDAEIIGRSNRRDCVWRVYLGLPAADSCVVRLSPVGRRRGSGRVSK